MSNKRLMFEKALIQIFPEVEINGSNANININPPMKMQWLFWEEKNTNEPMISITMTRGSFISRRIDDASDLRCVNQMVSHIKKTMERFHENYYEYTTMERLVSERKENDYR